MNEGVYIRPDPIPMGGDNEFANDTMLVRVPRIIRDVQAMNPHLGDAAQRRLDGLHAALTGHAPIAMLDALAPGPGYADWLAAHQAQRQKFDPLTWFNVDWFFAEIFCYRHIIEAVRWFETSLDPFAPKKREELASDRLLNLLKATQAIEGDFKERLATLLAFVLWGNRVDLSHPAGDLSAESAADDLLVDDRPALFEHMAAQHAGDTLDLSGTVIHIIADNAGTELATDLALVDLLTTGGGATVVLHVKAHPTFVSDAIAADVWDVMAVMQASGGTLEALATRLRRAWDAEQFKIAPDLYWNSSHFLWELPPTLHRVFRQASLVVLKGDVNYRRAVGDALWEPSTPFPAVTRYFPAPLLALRSIKCDVVVGLPPDVAPRLDALNPVWRTGGQYGVMQFSAPVRLAE